MGQHVEAARAYFTRGYNCAQAVFLAFHEEMGMDERTAARLASSFGGGMGKLREVCGAVSGGLMALGLLRGCDDPDDAAAKAAHYAKVQEFAARFKQMHESIICRELLRETPLPKEHTSAPEARSEAYYQVRPCARFVETAARVLEEMLEEQN